ncbi:MAG: type I secretion C-terminal target domain-containing protein, partial [Rhizobiaceae bacterium]|nr:type I secretion C-terminal target domain-containing protein [Rhizobiaceae bacterium]
HATANAEDDIVIDVTVTATDPDGDTASKGFTVTVDDDAPVIGVVNDVLMPSIDGHSVNGTWAPSFGADGAHATNAIGIALGTNPAGFTYTSTAMAGVFVGGVQVYQVVADTPSADFTFYTVSSYDSLTHSTTFTAYTSAPTLTAGNYTFPAGSEYFVLEMNVDGTYNFELINNDFLVSQISDFTQLQPTNYSSAMYIADGQYYDDATLPSGASPDVTIKGYAANGNASHIQVSNAGGGGLAPQNANFTNNERVEILFASPQTEIEFSVAKMAATESVKFQITIDNTHTTTVVILGSAPSFVIDAAFLSTFGLTSFSEIDITKLANASPPPGYSDDNQVTIGQIRYNAQVVVGDTELNFQVSITDGDGDTVIGTDELNVRIEGDQTGTGYALTGTDASAEAIAASSGVDTLNGGAGANDVADYSNSSAAVSINLNDTGGATGAPTDFANPEEGKIGGGYAAGDTLIGIEGLIGGAGDDYLFGNSGANYLSGGSGADTLKGEGGDDILIGGDGDDFLNGGAGSDTMTGGAGSDVFVVSADTLGSINDFIADFQDGSGGDTIDLTELLVGLTGVTDLEADGYVQIQQNGADAELRVDTDGAQNGQSFQTVAVLENYVFNTNAEAVKILFDDGSGTQTDNV